MSKCEDSWDRLDIEFDHFLLDMKPYVLKHPNKTGEIDSFIDNSQKLTDKIKQ